MVQFKERRMRRATPTVFAILLGMMCIGASSAGAAARNYAAGTSFGGYVDTAFDLQKAFKKRLTMTARFMPKYPYTAEGPIFGVRGKGDFYIGIGNFRELQRSGFDNYTHDAKLVVRVAGKKAVYQLKGDPGKNHRWRHLAITMVPRHGTGKWWFRVFVDGQQISARQCLPKSGAVDCPGTTMAADVGVTPAELSAVKGLLRIGQTSGTSPSQIAPLVPVPRVDDLRDDPGLVAAFPSSDLQFYGLIDDVGLFAKELSPPTIKSLAKGPRLTGAEQGVVAAYTFDDRRPNGQKLPGSFRRKTTFVPGRSARIRVSGTRSNGADSKVVAKLRPSQQVPWTLPFDKKQEWRVLWGNNTPNSSHNGFASFAWDFVLADPSVPNSATCGQNLHAVAAGSVYEIDDSGTKRPDLHPDGPNVLKIRHTVRERSSYLHIQTHSVRTVFTPVMPPPDIPVSAGQTIARVGTRQEVNTPGLVNCHLHLGSGGPGNATVPAEFSNYELKDPATGQWKPVPRGAPATGAIIRRP